MKNNINLIYAGFIAIFAIETLIISCNSNNSNSVNELKADSVKMRTERGKYLANYVSGCIDCHSQRDYTKFSGLIVPGSEGKGGEVFNEIYAIPGVVFARNITPDTINGIGNWTDEELVRAITRGIRKNGDTLFPIMPYHHYNQMSKEDIYSIITYIRTLQPNNNKVPERYLSVPVSVAYPPLASNSLDDNIKPDVSDMVKYGAYVVNSAACMDCHTPMENGKYNMDKLFAGGFTFNLGTFVANTANITPDSATGIGKWTEEMFLDKFKHYRDPAVYVSNPGKINSIMPWSLFSKMDDFDIKAMYRYLRTIKPVNNLVEKYPK
jgi:mono/diheme cytochrome c family protein